MHYYVCIYRYILYICLVNRDPPCTNSIVNHLKKWIQKTLYRIEFHRTEPFGNKENPTTTSLGGSLFIKMTVYPNPTLNFCDGLDNAFL